MMFIGSRSVNFNFTKLAFKVPIHDKPSFSKVSYDNSIGSDCFKIEISWVSILVKLLIGSVLRLKCCYRSKRLL